LKNGIQDRKKKSGFLLEFIPMKIGAGMTSFSNPIPGDFQSAKLIPKFEILKCPWGSIWGG